MTDAGQISSSTGPKSAALALRLALFYGLAFAIAWSAWLPLLLHKFKILETPIPFPIVLFVGQSIGAFAPLLSLLTMQKICRDPTLLSQVFAQLRFRGVPALWYLVPALTPVAVTLSISVVYCFLAGDPVAVLRPEPVQKLGWGLLLVIPFQFALGLIGSPLGEEPGWRGYALDQCARSGHALAGSGLVACLWWVWHLPLFVILGVDPNAYTFIAMAGHSLLIDSLFLVSNRNLLVAMLYHQGINTSFMFFASKVETLGGSIVLVLIALAVRTAAHRHDQRSICDASRTGGRTG